MFVPVPQASRRRSASACAGVLLVRAVVLGRWRTALLPTVARVGCHPESNPEKYNEFYKHVNLSTGARQAAESPENNDSFNILSCRLGSSGNGSGLRVAGSKPGVRFALC